MNKLIIYDWDNTILFTYFIFNTDYGKILESVREQKQFNNINEFFNHQIPSKEQETYNKYIIEIDKSATNLLRKSKEISETCIVTNALNGWVEESAKFYLPNVYKELFSIKIWSARSTFQLIYPEFTNKNFKLWKYKMFEHIVSNNKNKNLISVGDSDAEFNAMTDIKKENPILNISIIKFKPEPTIQYLKLEIDKCLKIVRHLKNNNTIYMEKELNKTIEGFIQTGGDFLVQNLNKIIWFNHCY